MGFIKDSFEKEISGCGLGVFRFFYAFTLLLEIAHISEYSHLMFDEIPYLNLAEPNLSLLIYVWFISVSFVAIGLFTRVSSIINYIITISILPSIPSFEYHIHLVYTGVNLLLMFIPVSQCLSVDRLIKKIKYSNTRSRINPSKLVPQFYYYIILFVAVGLVYFDSVFSKFVCDSWLSGLGLWVPASIPSFVNGDFSILLNEKYLMIALGYLTLLFETVFIFVFFIKKLRVPLFLIGVGLHFGIYLIFPIPIFALCYCAIYVLLVPVSFWEKLIPNSPKSPLVFHYDKERLLHHRIVQILEHFDWFSKISFKNAQDFDHNIKELSVDSLKELLDEVYVVSKTGKIYSRIDAYIQVFQRIPVFFIFSLILRIPGVNLISRKIHNYIVLRKVAPLQTEADSAVEIFALPLNNKTKILSSLSIGDLKLFYFKALIVLLTTIQMGNYLC